MKIELPYFGEIELEFYENEYADREGYEDYVHFGYSESIGYDEEYIDEPGCNFTFNGKPLDLDVNFTELSQSNISLVTNSLNKLDEIIRKGKKYLIADFNSKGEVKNYIDEWIEYYLDEEPFKELAKRPFSKETPMELLNKLEIVRIGFYSWAESHPYVIIDFAFGYDSDSGHRDNMLVIKLSKDYELMELTTEG